MQLKLESSLNMAERPGHQFDIEKIPEGLRQAYIEYVKVLDQNGEDYLVHVPGYPINRAKLAQHFESCAPDDPLAIAATLHFLDYTIKDRQQRGLAEVLTQEAVVEATIRRFQQDKIAVEQEREQKP